MHHLERRVASLESDITGLPDDRDDVALLQEYKQRIFGYKTQLSHLCEELLRTSLKMTLSYCSTRTLKGDCSLALMPLEGILLEVVVLR